MYELNQYMQDAVLKLLIEDKEFLRRGAGMIESSIFTESIRREISRESLNFYASYGDNVGYEVLSNFSIGGKARKEENYLEYLGVLKEMRVNRDFILGELGGFVRKMFLIRALDEAEELLSQNRVEEIEKRIIEASRKGSLLAPTYRNYFEDGLEAYKRREASPAVLLGIEKIDKVSLDNRGVEIGRLACFMGEPKGKKSWALIHIALRGAVQGLVALFVSLELSGEEVVRRFDGIVTGRGTRNLKEEDSKQILKSRKKLKRYGGIIFVEEFPQGTFSVKQLEGLIEKLEVSRGFSPILVVLDYADLMRGERTYRDTRDKYDEIFSDLRQLAAKRKIIIFTATRTQRASIGKSSKQKQHVSEDIRIMYHVDYMFGLSQLSKEVIRVNVVANRTGEEKVFADVKIDLGRGLVFGEEVNPC